MMKHYFTLIAEELSLPLEGVKQTIRLIEEGATVPFIARYRKETTGSLDEVQIRAVSEGLEKYDKLEKRKETILKTIAGQGQLRDELKSRITACFDPRELEDLYLPYKPKRRTRGMKAKEKGLEPLADWMETHLQLSGKEASPRKEAEKYLSEGLTEVEEALAGARDIIAERAAESPQVRSALRRLFEKESLITSSVIKKNEEKGAKYRDYFEWNERLSHCPSHRYLALRRGESEGILRVHVAPKEKEKALWLLKDSYVGENLHSPQEGSHGAEAATALEDAYHRLIAPSLENEFLGEAKKKADEEAVKVFATNLRQLLLAPPLGRKRVMAIDPGYRTGCKLVCLDEQGGLLHATTIYPHEPQKRREEAGKVIGKLVEEYRPEAVAVGGGTAGRETEQLVRETTTLPVFLVNEDGASVYSASEVGRREFPRQDVTVRGAVSIGRRLMDPLSELVKIDPKSLGIGQYQHDVDQKILKRSLDGVVESCVNVVGVDLNTAGESILHHVSGLGAKLARGIVDYRGEHGAFESREQLKQVPGMGPKAFQQAAGFLRIPESPHPLDASAVHPESYYLVESMAKDLVTGIAQLMADEGLRTSIQLSRYVSDEVGMPTLKDILKELSKPGRDPRPPIEEFAFREDVTVIEDLEEGMILPGRVRNITRFGAFVDIGIKQDGLIHISEMADRFVKDPSEVVSLGENLRVRVLEVDTERDRIALSLKGRKEQT